jgi:hypothetical protein
MRLVMAEGQKTGVRKLLVSEYLPFFSHNAVVRYHQKISGRYEKHLILLELKFTRQGGVLGTMANEELQS